MEDNSSQDPLEKFQRYLNRVFEPKTEEDHLQALHFCFHVVMANATKEYQGWAGVVSYDAEIDFDEVLKKLTPQLLDPIIKLVPLICSRFNVAHPAQKITPKGIRSFKKWHTEMCKKLKIEDEYPDFILDRIPEISEVEK